MAGRQTRPNPSSQWIRSCASRPGCWGEDTGKPRGRGVDASQRLSFRTRGQARALANGVQSRDQNRTREIRPSGIVEGLQETRPLEAVLRKARAPDFYLDRTCQRPCSGIRMPPRRCLASSALTRCGPNPGSRLNAGIRCSK
jgi:hypothetical protein